MATKQIDLDRELTCKDIVAAYTAIQQLQYGAIEERLQRLDKHVASIYPKLSGNEVAELVRAQRLARAHHRKLVGVEKRAEALALKRKQERERAR